MHWTALRLRTMYVHMPAAIQRLSGATCSGPDPPLPTYTSTLARTGPCHIRQGTDSSWPGLPGGQLRSDTALLHVSATITTASEPQGRCHKGPGCVRAAHTPMPHTHVGSHRHLVCHTTTPSKPPPGAQAAHHRHLLHPLPHPSPHTAPPMTYHVQQRDHEQPAQWPQPDKQSHPIRHFLQYTVTTCPAAHSLGPHSLAPALLALPGASVQLPLRSASPSTTPASSFSRWSRLTM